MLSCRDIRDTVDEATLGCSSWVELGQRLPEPVHSHLSQCPACRQRVQQMLELEQQLMSLAQEEEPSWDISSAVMARIAQPESLPAPTSLPWAAYTPLLLVLAVFAPDPQGLPNGWSMLMDLLGMAWRNLGMPTYNLDLTGLLPTAPPGSEVLLGLILAVSLAATWKWRKPARA